MDFNLKQWRDQQHESEEEQQQHQQSSAKIPRYLLLQSPQQQQQHQQQQQEIAALPLFVSCDSQPNKISTHLSSSSYSDHPSSTPTAIPSRFPRGGKYSFSTAQWQELELQALIYRHMVAGASVPPELLQLVKKSLLASSPYFLHHYSPHFQPVTSLLQAGYWGKGAMDPEPGRCRRTDGKKWRCSRDVVAGHKYCERHMHRGRNRSRKPVEFPAAAATASANNAALVGSLNNNNNASTAFAARSSIAASANDTQFSLSRAGASSFDAFQLDHGSSDKGNLFGPQLDSSLSGDGGRSNNNNSNRVLMHLFDDWPRSDNAEGNNISSTSLSISTPGNPTSDFLRLSTGNGEELGRRDGSENGNEERERGQQMSWSNGGGWGGNSMGGPLAEALRSSSNSSPTSVLHQLPRCSAPDTSFVSA